MLRHGLASERQITTSWKVGFSVAQIEMRPDSHGKVRDIYDCGNKLLMVGSLAVVMSVLFALDAKAGHRSHGSHSSHQIQLLQLSAHRLKISCDSFQVLHDHRHILGQHLIQLT